MEDIKTLLKVIEWMSEIITEEVLMGSMYEGYNEVLETYREYNEVVADISNKYNI